MKVKLETNLFNDLLGLLKKYESQARSERIKEALKRKKIYENNRNKHNSHQTK